MAEPATAAPPRPSLEPVYTNGNIFWRGNERFLIKGISYIPRLPGGKPYGTESQIDPLVESRLDELKRDIEIFQELGLNTIQVTALNPWNSHEKAIHLLAEAGIYVLIKVCGDLGDSRPTPPNRSNHGHNFDISPYYTTELLRPVFKTVDELANYSNVLGFIVGGDAIWSPGVSKIAEVSRAITRDIKAFLNFREGRKPPVGFSVNDMMLLKLQMLQYFTAGATEDRADFFAPDSWSWAYKSSFKISGWESLVQNLLDKYPVPMFVAAYGSVVGKTRIWEEVECLYSPDMTGVFSGGCLHTYHEHGNNYGTVQIGEDGKVYKKREFQNLKKHFGVVNKRSPQELYSAEVKDYEQWRGEFPATTVDKWHATENVPSFPGSLEGLLHEMRDEKEWELVDVPSSTTSEGQTRAVFDDLAEVAITGSR